MNGLGQLQTSIRHLPGWSGVPKWGIWTGTGKMESAFC